MRARRRRTADADGAFWPFLTYRMPGMRRWFLSAMNFKHTICSIFAPEQKPSKHRSTPHSLERQARRRYILVEKAFCFLWFVLYQVQLPNPTERENGRWPERGRKDWGVGGNATCCPLRRRSGSFQGRVILWACKTSVGSLSIRVRKIMYGIISPTFESAIVDLL